MNKVQDFKKSKSRAMNKRRQQEEISRKISEYTERHDKRLAQYCDEFIGIFKNSSQEINRLAFLLWNIVLNKEIKEMAIEDIKKKGGAYNG